MSKRWALIFFVLAVVAVVAAVGQPWVWLQIALGCSSVAFLVMAAAYLGAGPRVFLKTKGRPHAVSWVWMWPIYLLNGLLFNVVHHLSWEPPYAEVAPGLYLGRRLWNREARRLGACGVLDLTCEFPENRSMRGAERYLCLPVLDNTCPTPEQLREGVRWLAESLQHGPVYVHCAAGHGRSATVVAAYLLAAGVVRTVEEGVAHLKAKRPGVRINRCQRAALDAYVRQTLPEV